MRLRVTTATDLLQHSAGQRSGMLGVVQYGSGESHAGLGRVLAVPVAAVRAATLGSTGDVCEAWQSPRPVHGGRDGPVHWCADGVLAFLAVNIPDNGQHLEDAARSAYCALFSEIDALGYPHLLRVWNHIAGINDASSGLERYRQFNIGRQQAFMGSGRHVAGASVPAASALGADDGSPLTLYALASRQQPMAVENPRQMSAYHYPGDYGPCPPIFSRANLVDLGSPVLFVSGTASILGHQNMHVGNCREQTRETLRNINALLEEVRIRHGVHWCTGDLRFKAYLRHAEDLPVVQEEMERAAGRPISCLFIQADVCRSELLVEIEGIALPAD